MLPPDSSFHNNRLAILFVFIDEINNELLRVVPEFAKKRES
jgi:hypothetical protein